jgi:DNA repair protein RadC
MRCAAQKRATLRYDRVGLTVREGKGPREQILEEGAESLSDRELLAAVLGTGCLGTPVTGLAEVLLRDGSLESLARSSPRELRRVRGLGTARACQLLAAFEVGRRAFGRACAVEHPIRTPQDLLPLVQHYASARKEHFLAVLLNTRHLPINVEIVSVGSLNASIVHPREVFRPAIVAAAASVILVHNHPSGDTTPSEDDLEITQRLCRVGEMAGIEVLDHIILGTGNPFSFKEAGLI